MIGRWYSRQLLTNHKGRLSTQTISGILAPTPCTHSPYRQAISYSQASDPGIVLDGGRNLMKEQGAAKVMIATCSRQRTSNLFSICHLINEK